MKNGLKWVHNPFQPVFHTPHRLLCNPIKWVKILMCKQDYSDLFVFVYYRLGCCALNVKYCIFPHLF